MSTLSYTLAADLDVYKALTALIDEDGQTHNDVLRHLLNLDSLTEAEAPVGPLNHLADHVARANAGGNFYSRGLLLANGTELRARYKGEEYRAQIQNGHFITEDGESHDSPSAAATHITSNTVNGLRFWEAMRPGDRGWRRLDVIRDAT